MSILKNIILGIGVKILSLIIVLVTNILLARYLSINEFGIFNYIITIIGILAPLLDLGVSQILVKEMNSQKNFNEIITSGIIIRICGGTLAIIIFLILLKYNFIGIESKRYVYIIIIILLLRVTEIYKYIFEGQQLFKMSFIPSVISSGIFLLLSGVILIFFKIDIESLFYLKIIEEIILALLYFYIFKIFNKQYFIKINFQQIISIFKQAIPLTLSGIATILYLKVDQIMIGNMLGTEEVALYSVGIKFAEVWYFVPSLISTVYYPKLVILFNKNKEEYKNKKQELYFSEIILSILFAFGMTIISKYLILFLYGENYKESYKILNVYVWAGVPYSLLFATSKILILLKKTKEVFYRSLITCLLNIVLNYYLILKLGIVGAAYSTLISYFFIIISLSFIGCKEEIKDIVFSYRFYLNLKENYKFK